MELTTHPQKTKAAGKGLCYDLCSERSVSATIKIQETEALPAYDHSTGMLPGKAVK